MNISDNSLQQDESVSQDITNQGMSNQNPGSSTKSEKGVQNPDDEDDKSRREQVMARINDEPESDGSPVNADKSVTNKDSKVTNAPQKDNQGSGNNDADETRDTAKSKP